MQGCPVPPLTDASKPYAECLAAFAGADPHKMQDAQNKLVHMVAKSGSLQALLPLCIPGGPVSESVVRLAGTQVLRIIKTSYRTGGVDADDVAGGATSTTPLVSEDDRAFFRKYAMGLLAVCIPDARAVIVEAIQVAMRGDFPQVWGKGLFDQSCQLAQYGAANPEMCLRGLMVLHKVANIFNNAVSSLDILGPIGAGTLTVMKQVLDSLKLDDAVNAQDEQRALIAHWAFKTLNRMTLHDIPDTFFVDEFAPYACMMHAATSLMKQDIPVALLTTAYGDDRSDWVQHPWWKAKKWAVRFIANGLDIVRRTETEEAQSKKPTEMHNFWKYWMATHFEVVWKMVLGILSSISTDNVYVTPIAQSALISMLDDMCRRDATFGVLRDKVGFIIQQIVFPPCRFDAEREAMFNETPEEYLIAMTGSYGSGTRNEALLLLGTLLKNRTKTCVNQLLALSTELFTAFEHQPTKEAAVGMEMILTCIGSNASTFMRLKKTSKQIESMLNRFIVPHVVEASKGVGRLMSYPWLLARCMAFYGAFARIDFGEAPPFENMTRAVVQITFLSFENKNLVVAGVSAGVLRQLLCDRAAEDVIRPHVAKLLGIFLELNTLVDNEEVCKVMDQFTNDFPDEVAQASEATIRNMLDKFRKMRDMAGTGDESDINLDVAAGSTLQSIRNVIGSVYDEDNDPDAEKKDGLSEIRQKAIVIISSYEGDVLNLVKHLLMERDGEFFEDALVMVDMFISIRRGLSEAIINVVPFICAMAKYWGTFMLTHVVPIVDLLVRYSEAGALAKPNAVGIFERASKKDEGSFVGAGKVSTMDVIMDMVKAVLDTFQEESVKLAIQLLSQKQSVLATGGGEVEAKCAEIDEQLVECEQSELVFQSWTGLAAILIAHSSMSHTHKVLFDSHMALLGSGGIVSETLQALLVANILLLASGDNDAAFQAIMTHPAFDTLCEKIISLENTLRTCRSFDKECVVLGIRAMLMRNPDFWPTDKPSAAGRLFELASVMCADLNATSAAEVYETMQETDHITEEAASTVMKRIESLQKPTADSVDANGLEDVPGTGEDGEEEIDLTQFSQEIDEENDGQEECNLEQALLAAVMKALQSQDDGAAGDFVYDDQPPTEALTGRDVVMEFCEVLAPELGNVQSKFVRILNVCGIDPSVGGRLSETYKVAKEVAATIKAYEAEMEKAMREEQVKKE